ncbi:hypothetical protein [Maribacter sp. 2307ULW6-5]|uniref:hypothetical protein n=1 Tax=Maribacter sp. 2307ULW6-5 TaxID=3386275 RepID=UPI0039BD0794
MNSSICKRTPWLLALMLLLSCSGKLTEKELAQLNGYWEIKEVVFPDGSKKAYQVNLDVDFFSLDGLRGYRKKMKPQFTGTFATSDDAQPLVLQQNQDQWEILYENDLDSWKEILVALTANKLSLENEAGIRYHYERFEPINLEN